MKQLSVILATLALLFSAAVAQEAQQPGQAEGEQAMLRIAHLAADAPAVRVTIHGQEGQDQAAQEQMAQNGFESLSFRDVSDYQAVPAGSLIIEVYAEEQAEGQTEGQANGQAIFTGVLELEAGRHYTLVALQSEDEAMRQDAATQEQATTTEEDAEPEDEAATETEATQEPAEDTEAPAATANGLQFQLFEDEVTEAPAENESLVRVVHALAGAGAVDVAAVDANVVVEGLEYARFSEYFSVPDGVSLEIRAADAMTDTAQQQETTETAEEETEETETEETAEVEGEQENGQVIAEIGANELQPGSIYTVFITADEQGQADLLIIEDMIDTQMHEEDTAEETVDTETDTETDIEIEEVDTEEDEETEGTD